MSELKIKTHTTYIYETSDGREFDEQSEAEAWQNALNRIKDITMLNSKFKPTVNHDEAFYVYIKTWEQQEAFEAMQVYEGIGAHIPKPGYWYYDDCTDSYRNVVEERDWLQGIIEELGG